MRIHESGENYLEAILMLSIRNGSVRSIDIANELNFTKPSVSIAMKNFRESGYIIVDENGYITLTDEGKRIAEKVYEKHKLLSEMFILLGVDKDTAVADACRIEHHLSPETFEAIKRHYEKHANEK